MISVGIDVSKGKSTVCVMKPGGEVLKTPFEILHTKEDLCALIKTIDSYDEEVRVVLENTGYYHWPVVTALVEHGIFVCVVNALRMKKYCAQSIRKVKNDKIDSIRIASYGITYWSELVSAKASDEIYTELRLLARQYYQTVSMLVKARVNLSNLIDQAMPGINKIMQDSRSNHKLTDFVARYWHLENITTMGTKRFTSDYCKWAKKQGYLMSERLASQILAVAQNGIPVLPNSPVTKVIVTEAVRVVHQIELTRDTILAQMQELAKTLPEYSVLINMPGIGDTYAARLIAEIGDVRRFKNKHALIAYAGIDAPPYQSGSFNANERHISKRGNKYLRKTGYEVMQYISGYKPEGDAVYEFIAKKLAEGKAPTDAKVSGLNKFLRVYYGRVTELYKSLDEQIAA